ncbi:Anthranilate phosphoribosyltransferase [Prochlorococcus marinus str. MIT 9321]|uniref:Anthranilate phosphoribosyltransferase n=1 Tax=Prochlorococcus marinus str. MIT 9401 TaxID=167551 RepID=A0A0A2B1T8_PROMR|nr:anthranilate phosphoribosyltransferase [Prochlorococcus marinus]KGG04421.1 Anthranilate phosphoribosyltransferase [Prochlorococcus marinus str. MIT 9322]KGG05125.1 Anthranilate phosphoribosyltransferase [Prochlorococcus marinus str. MIT 9321]KGG07102.1 Anthranilate phosphoribosyltransferase [Prochlorococcus marinus str. MIT 9401]
MSSNLSNPEILNSLLEGENLDDPTSRLLMKRWLNSEISDVQTGAFLSALRAKGCSGAELSSMAEELLNVCELPVARPNLYMVDTCGTGGDGANTFNISTAVAFVASSCGVNIAKHGNKSASGKVGSADVLLNLGLNLNCSLEKVISAVTEIGITFLFAPVWHKSLIKLAPLRKDLGIRTVFNQLGPLVNPLRPNAQVLGVASEDLLEPMGSALLNMGMDRVVVVHGYGGLDEASLQGDNKLIFVEKGKLRFSKINISDFNHENTSNVQLVVSDSDSNEEILRSVLNGSGKKSHKEVVALNSALVLWAAGIENDLHEGFNKSLYSINQGNPWKKFSLLKTYLSSDKIIENT